MLAGIGSVPAALLVVAADDGWSAQTAEHVAVLDALGVRHALLAVTKSDLADPAPVLADVRERLAATSMGAVPAVAVSALTGAGVPEFTAALERLLAGPARARSGRARAAVDRPRVHHQGRGDGGHRDARRGCGRAGGPAAAGRPGRRRARACSRWAAQVERAEATARVALNLRGVAVEEISRGDALLTPGAFRSTAELDVSLVGEVEDRLPGEAVVHVGSATVGARLRPLDGAVVRLRLDDAAAAAGGRPAAGARAGHPPGARRGRP